MREPRGVGIDGDIGFRITPACAGTTGFPIVDTAREKDHPRVCGNHSECNHYVYFLRGSPPRVREPPQVAGVWKQWRRITPACAGTTDFAVSSASFPKDHPRVCGNHAIQITTQAHISGSPPRVREPPAIPSRTDSRIRITPACAGTTTLYFIVDNYCWDHPRVCGNHCPQIFQSKSGRGSPPRVREPHIIL